MKMLRFSLRTTLIVTAVVAVACALPLRRAILQERGREWVLREGGHVTFTHEIDGTSGTHDYDAEPPAPKWLIDVIGIDFFDSVHCVVLDNQMVNDLNPITDITQLRSLYIVIEIDKNLDFSPLAELERLEKVHLDYTGISADHLAELRKMLPNVRVDATNHPSPSHQDAARR